MRASNRAKSMRSQPPGWCLLAEFTLGDLLPDYVQEKGLPCGFLAGQFREWGVPPELIQQIEWSLSEAAHKAGGPGQAGGPGHPGDPGQAGSRERPGRLRVFGQKLSAGARAARIPISAAAEPAPEASSSQDRSGRRQNRGWGYFIIDRSGSGAGSSERGGLKIDLYLYQEGE